MIGSELVIYLRTLGHEVIPIIRSKPNRELEDSICWDPDHSELEAAALEGFDAVVHLAGENVAGGKWTEDRKSKILNSRIRGTHLLSQTLVSLQRPPKVLISASAIGYYGDRGDQILSEDSPVGEGFLAKVCHEWEAAVTHGAGIRVVTPRLGVVLSPKGGALSRMLLPFRLGMGGPIGSGKQYMSWISLDDAIYALYHLLTHQDISGPVNLVSPNPVTNREFIRTLGRCLFRPTIIPLPEFAVRMLWGEMGQEMLLSSTRVLPTRLEQTGFSCRYPSLEQALRYMLDRSYAVGYK
jgi:hypothetical protein